MAIYETLYPQGNFLDIRANAPTSTDYNIQVMEDLVRNLPGGGIRDLLAPAAAATLSLPYDAIQAATRTTEDDISRAMETTGMYGPKDIASEAYGLAYERERPLSTAIERTIGASAPLAERLSNSKGIPFALPNLDYRNYDLSNLFNTTEPDLNNSALARRLMTQPGLDKFTGINKGVYDPYGIKVEDGRFSYDMNKTSLADYQKPKNRFTGMDLESGYLDRAGSSDENIYEETEKKKSNGIMDFLSSLPSPINILRSIAQGTGQPYERYTPGGTIRDGIYSIGGVNVPVSMMNDFYNPRTGLNRFDRARQRYEQTGRVRDLFASSRTGKEFFEKMRDRKAAERKALEKTAAAKLKYKTYTSGGGDRDPGPRFDTSGAAPGTSLGSGQFSPSSSKGRRDY